jgi:hypothetical protein
VSTGGRAAREAARTRSPDDIATLIERFAGEGAPWLLATGAAPKGAHVQLKAVRQALYREARTQAEAAAFSQAFLDRIDAWNAAHPGAEVAPPGPITGLNAQPPAWNEDSLALLGEARRARGAFKAAHEALAETPAQDADQVAGLALLSAVFDSACLARDDLALFAAWLADPKAAIVDAPDLPPWVDLKRRVPSGRGRSRRRLLRKISGVDSVGGYALRRLFLAPRTLALIALHDRLGGAPDSLRLAARLPDRLLRLMTKSCGLSSDLALTPLLKGARMLLEIREGRPDHTMALLSARRLETFAATPESWTTLITGPVALEAAASEPIDVSQLLTPSPKTVAQALRPAPDDPAFFQLHAALSSSQKARADLTTSDTKLTSRALSARLKALPWSDATPSSIRLLRDWYLHLLEVEGKAVNSIRRYHSTLGAVLCDMAGPTRLEACDADAFEELYTLILETDQRSAREQSHLRGRLGMLHAFAVQDPRWDFPELAGELLPMEDSVTHVRSALLGRAGIDRARDILRAECGLPPEVARAADAAMLAISRGALRIGEAVKALLSHLEETGSAGDERREATLFVRPSVFGDNKTPGAYRQIRLLQLMTPDEADDFEAYLAYRRTLTPKGPLFGVLQADGTVAPFNARELGKIIAVCLRRATGLADASAHALRRAAATGLFLAIHEARTPGSALGPFLERLTGWRADDRARVVEAVAPLSQPRDAWRALARFLGHGGPGTSFESYIVATDLAIYETCADRRASQERVAEGLAQMGERHVALSPEPMLDVPGPRAEIWGTVTSPAQALLNALQEVDDGRSPDAAARANYLPIPFLRDRLAIARAWSRLTTNRKQKPTLRLQPPGHSKKLAPAPLGTGPKQAEALLLADRLIARAAEEPGSAENWIATTLHDATMGNAGTRLRTPDALESWCRFAATLREPSRWLVERIDPPGATRKEKALWVGARHAEMQAGVRQSKTARSIAVRCRFLSPAVSDSRKGAPAESWAGCVRFAAHLAAIYLGYAPVTAEDKSDMVLTPASDPASS